MRRRGIQKTLIGFEMPNGRSICSCHTRRRNIRYSRRCRNKVRCSCLFCLRARARIRARVRPRRRVLTPGWGTPPILTTRTGRRRNHMTCRGDTPPRYGRRDGALVIHGMRTLPMSSTREGGPISQILGRAWPFHSRGGVSPMSTTRGREGWFAPTPSVARPLCRRRPIRSRPLEEERAAYPFRYACARNPFRGGDQWQRPMAQVAGLPRINHNA